MSVMSTKFAFTPNLATPWLSREKVQPYSVSLATTSSPAATEVQMAAAMAPMPEAVTRAASPFSREASFSSTAAREGLLRRV